MNSWLAAALRRSGILRMLGCVSASRLTPLKLSERDPERKFLLFNK